MKKLTETQIKLLNKINEDLIELKKYETAKEYFIAIDTKGQQNRPDYEELKRISGERYDRYKEDYDEMYGKEIKRAKENNELLTIGNTSTLKALEKAGYIKMINNGGRYPDTVKVIEREK